jgi:hypothetical protein
LLAIALGPLLPIFADIIDSADSFLPASFVPNPASFEVWRIVNFPSLIGVDQAEENFVVKQMFDPF